MKYKKYGLMLIVVFAFVIGMNTIYANEININGNNGNNNIQSTKIENFIKISDLTQFGAIRKDECVGLFGDKNNPESISYLIHQVLDIPKIVVPILVILLGTLDFAKAVIAGKEDEMKKNQTTFIKRVLIGIVIFFVPTILDLIMYFADFILEGTMCSV